MSGSPATEETPSGHGVSLDLPLTRDAVEAARVTVEGYLAPLAIEPRATYRIEVVLEELVSNVVRHAAGATFVRVAASWSDGVLGICIEDDGIAFDPLAAPPAQRYTSLEDAIPGGQGIALVRKLTRSFTWVRDGERNRTSVAIDAPSAN